MNPPLGDRSGMAGASIPSNDWLADFVPYSWQHVMSSSFFLGIIAVLVVLGLRWRGTTRERRFRLTWGCLALATQSFELYWWCRPSAFLSSVSLPIHMCDLAAWFAVFCLLTEARIWQSLLFYVGIFLSSMAFFTPVISDGEGMGTLRYWLFFVGHTHIVGASVYQVAVLGFRPTWRDFCIVVGLGINYVIVVAFLNVWIGSDANYGFLGSRERQPGVVLLLGAYPMRIVWMSLVVIALFAIATAIGRRRSPATLAQPS